jgi:N-carbamoyl-L-amino-acid hydrolase
MKEVKQPLLTIKMDRLKEMINISAGIGTLSKGGLCRLTLSDEDKEMRDIFVGWLEDNRLQVRVDDFGNIYGRREGRIKDAAPVMVGSHLDTQPEGGRFDGILGVLCALEAIQVLNDHQIETDRPIEIINFTNEEGTRFEPALLGSGAVTGIFSEEYVFGRTDRAGKTFGEELKRIGYAGSKAARLANVHRFVELHVEQGPVLERDKITIGAVEGVQGMTWLEVKVTGEADHAGPTPMPMRKDALVAASKMITAIQEAAFEVDEAATTTVGRIEISPNSINCVPGQVIFSIDVRHFDNALKVKTVELVTDKITQIAASEKVGLEITKLWDIDATHFSQDILEKVIAGADAHGYSSKRMISGAGHDAKYMNDIVPSAMIFVPSVNGKSHCQEELTYWEDIEKGANVLLYVVNELAQE